MYKIYVTTNSTRTLIYNDLTPELTDTKLIDPVLDLKDNAAGSLTFTMPKGNAAYSTIAPIKTTVQVYRDNNWLWTGRVLIIEKNFWLQKKVTCEGALAFLNDTIAPLHKYSNTPIASYVQSLLDIHNSKVDANRKIYRGAISGTTSSGAPVGNKDYIVEDDKILSYIVKIAEDWGFHIRLRESSGNLYLDMLTDDQLNMATQRIDFGKNLLDYSDNYDWTSIITVLHPVGAKLDTNNTTGDEDYPDHVVIKSNPSTPGLSRSGEYLINTSARNTYGRIEATVDWSEVDDPATLLSLAELYLSDYQYNEMKLTVKVIDLHYLTHSTVAFNFLDQINCYSRPHAMNTTFIASEMKIPFDKPEQTTFQFTKSTQGFYGSDRQSSGLAMGKISAASAEIVSKDSILKTARENATAMIDMATNGFVTMVPTTKGDRTSAIVIANNVDPNAATRKWTWNVNGLMHQKRSSASASWEAANVAITMDGSIVATYITTGVLTVAASGGGVLFSADMTNNTVHIAGFTVKGTALYSGKSTLDSMSNGVYLGIDGVSTGSGTMFIAMADGYIYGGKRGENGYVGFNNYNANTGVYGTRIAGKGCVAVLTDGFFGVGRYGTIDTDVTVDQGVNNTIKVPCNFQLQNSGGNITLTWDYTDYYFKHGLLNSA